jgi:hypothetical protein
VIAKATQETRDKPCNGAMQYAIQHINYEVNAMIRTVPDTVHVTYVRVRSVYRTNREMIRYTRINLEPLFCSPHELQVLCHEYLGHEELLELQPKYANIGQRNDSCAAVGGRFKSSLPVFQIVKYGGNCGRILIRRKLSSEF